MDRVPLSSWSSPAEHHRGLRVLVLGGYGASGAHAVELLRASGHDPLVAGRDAQRADVVIDLRDPERARLTELLAGVDVVINASGVEDPQLAVEATSRGIAFVDITATGSYVAALEAERHAAPVVLSVGLAPGLTNLLARALSTPAPGRIDLAIVLGAGERHGAAGVEWTYGLLGRRFIDATTGRSVRNFSQSKRFDLPDGTVRRLLRADFSDQHVLTRDLGVPVRTYFGLDSRVATATLAALTWIPGARHAPRHVPVPGGDRWLLVASAADGSSRWARGRLQSAATGALAFVAATRAARLPAGVHHLHQILDLTELPTDLGVELGVVPGPRAATGHEQADDA